MSASRLLAIAVAALPLVTGCASTNTVLRLGLNADVTEFTRGCERNRDVTCGRPGARETAFVEVMWAPSIKPGPYCSLSHQSSPSTTHEQVIDMAGCGGFFQFGQRD